MKKFELENNLSGVLIKRSVKPGATIITKVSVDTAEKLNKIPTIHTVAIDPDPFVDNSFKIAFSKAPVKGKYPRGTEVTVTVEPGFYIEEVLVNSDEVTAANGTYTFTITEATDIVVTSKKLFIVVIDPATSDNFTVTYSTTAKSGKYVDGTVVTVVAAEGKTIDEIKINNVDKTHVVVTVDGKTAAITIEADSTIEVSTDIDPE